MCLYRSHEVCRPRNSTNAREYHIRRSENTLADVLGDGNQPLCPKPPGTRALSRLVLAFRERVQGVRWL